MSKQLTTNQSHMTPGVDLAQAVADILEQSGIDPPKALGRVVEVIGERLGGRRVCVFEVDPTSRRFSNVAEWNHRESRPRAAQEQGLRYVGFTYIPARLGAGLNVELRDLDNPPPGAEAEASAFKLFGTRSVIEVPFHGAPGLCGALTVEYGIAPGPWDDKDVQDLRAISGMVTTFIAGCRGPGPEGGAAA